MAYVVQKLTGKQYQIPTSPDPTSIYADKAAVEAGFAAVSRQVNELLNLKTPLTSIGESRLQDLLSDIPSLEKATGRSFNFGGAPAVAFAITPTTPIDYSLHQGESIDAYNARIAAARAGTQAGTITPSSSATPKVISPQDYQMTPSEISGGFVGIEAYNKRISQLRGDVQTQADNLALTPAPGTGRRGEDFYNKAIDLLKGGTLGGAAPTMPSAQVKTQELISQYLTPAENEYNAAKTDLANFENTLLAEADKFKGEQVSSTVINRKLVKLNADNAEQLRQAQSKVQNAADRLNSQQKVVSLMMDAYQWDYQQANSQYQFEYNKNFQILNAIKGWSDKEKDNDRADFTIISNLVNNNPEAFKNPTQEQKNVWNDIELKVGYSLGTIEGLSKAAPGFKSFYQDESYDANGNKVITFYGVTKQGEGKIINVIKTTGKAAGTTTPDVIQYYADQVKSGTIYLTDVPAETRNAVAKVLAQPKTVDFTGITFSGLDAILKDGSKLTFPNQKSLDQFKKDNNIISNFNQQNTPLITPQSSPQTSYQSPKSFQYQAPDFGTAKDWFTHLFGK